MLIKHAVSAKLFFWHEQNLFTRSNQYQKCIPDLNINITAMLGELIKYAANESVKKREGEGEREEKERAIIRLYYHTDHSPKF